MERMYRRRRRPRVVGIFDIPDLIDRYGRQKLIDMIRIINPEPERNFEMAYGGTVEISGDESNIPELVDFINRSQTWKAEKIGDDMATTQKPVDMAACRDIDCIAPVDVLLDALGNTSSLKIGQDQDGAPMIYSGDKIVLATTPRGIEILSHNFGCGKLGFQDIQVIRAFFDMIVPKEL